jgi:hypothetical protein
VSWSPNQNISWPRICSASGANGAEVGPEYGFIAVLVILLNLALPRLATPRLA